MTSEDVLLAILVGFIVVMLSLMTSRSRCSSAGTTSDVEVVA